MAVTDECTLRIIGRYQSQNIVNTMHYRITTQASSELEVLGNLCDLWDSSNKADWLAAHSTAYELIGLKAFGKTGTAKTPGVKSLGDGGTRSGTPAPNFVCRTITLYTADVKHRRRGRLMLSGTITEDLDTNDGSLTSGGLAVMDNLGIKAIAQLTGGGDDFDPGIPAAGVDIWQNFTDYASRETPSSVTSRRVREFYIG